MSATAPLTETLELAGGDLRLHLLPRRGLDVGRAWFGDREIAWLSPLGEIDWQGDFARSFGGGLLTTCGLRNVGVPSEGQPQHGWYSSLPARDVELDPAAATARARIVEADVPGETLELRREIRLAGNTVHVTDETRNLAPYRSVAPLLYHLNLLWSGIESDAEEIVPRDRNAAEGDWRELGPPGPERVYEHIGARTVTVQNGATTLTVTSNLPRLWQWIEPSYGVLGVEPANCSVLGRAHDRAEGRLPLLEPGEKRTTTLSITVEAR